jgi:hypothetical protein
MFEKSNEISLEKIYFCDDIIKKNIIQIEKSNNISIITNEVDNIYLSLNFSFNNFNDWLICGCCQNNIYNNFLTKVQGTYKFHHVKFRTLDYYICPICMYLGTKNKLYSNKISENTTNDENGYIKYKSSNYDTNWVVVHPSIKNQYDATEKCGCDYFSEEEYCGGCDCIIDERFCEN